MKKDIVKYIDPATGCMTMSEVINRMDGGDVRTVKDGMRTENEATSIYETLRDTIHKLGPVGPIFTVPKGTEVVPANNLPDGGFWVLLHSIDGVTDHKHYDEVESYSRNYGFWVPDNEVDIALPF